MGGNPVRNAIAVVLVWFVVACGDDTGGKQPVDAGGKDTDAGGGGGVQTFDRSKYSDVGLTSELDYSTREYWLCRPDSPSNECARNLDATEVKADGSVEVIHHEAAKDPGFDCFYVFPTIWINRTPQMTDFSDTGVTQTLDALLGQAARFSRICRLFVPLYRQAGLMNYIPAGDKNLALQDIRDAFAYYLAHDNHGRKFVLISHSQGTFVASEMIRRDVQDDDAVRAQLISAALIGGQPYAPVGAKVGGTFKNLPACSEPGQTGCIFAWNSFAKEAPATPSSQFGHVVQLPFDYSEVDATADVICTEPAALAGNTGRYAGTYFPLMLHSSSTFAGMPAATGFTTPYVLYRNFFQGRCVHGERLNYLEIAAAPDEGDLRPVPAYRNDLLESVGFGLHVLDFAFAQDDLIEAVRLQAEAAGAL